MDEQTWYIHTIKYYSAKVSKESLTHAEHGRTSETLLGERSEVQSHISYDSIKGNIQEWENTETKYRSVVAEGWRRGRWGVIANGCEVSLG